MKRLFLIILFLSVALIAKAAYSEHTLNTHRELKPVPYSFKIARSQFLPDYQAGVFRFEGGDSSAEACPPEIYKYTKDNCLSPNTPQQACGGRYRVCGCASPYIYTDEQCAAIRKEGGGESCTVTGGTENGTVYYTACSCPSSYIKLSDGQICNGAECSHNKEKYCDSLNNIECESHYKVCGQNQSGKGQQCTANGQTKYTECSCDTALYPQTTETCKAEFGENATLDGTICGDNERGTSCRCDDKCPASHPDESCGSLGAAEEIDNGCGRKCFICNSCSPTCTDESNCPYGSETIANGCGGTCNKCIAEPSGAIIFTYSPTEDGITLQLQTDDYPGVIANYNVDWGDGSFDNNLTTFNPKHTYEKAGDYDVKITGSLGKLKQITGTYVTKIKQLNLSSMKEYYKTFFLEKRITGTIPELPPYLVSGYRMFEAYENSNTLTGNIPKLPETLTNAYRMFVGNAGLTGNIPELPKSLIDVRNMFADCSGLTGSIPDLPPNITDGTTMFFNCRGLTGTIPELPKSLTTTWGMFMQCSGLTGSIPELPPNLIDGARMFWGCSGLTGSIPELPATLIDGERMFAECSGLSGVTPVNGQYPYQYLTKVSSTTKMVTGCSEEVRQHFPTDWGGSCTSCQ